MTHAAELPAWAAWCVALLLLLGAGITLIGSLGLLRLDGFYQRAHAPTLGTTLGTAFIVGASMLCFSLLESRPLLHEVLILGFVTITTPVTLMLLVRAALFRDTAEGHIDDIVRRARRKPGDDEDR
ncbi:potassium:proton antiporter [Rhodopseudomonas sp. WA056]|uniref:Monovalent cation/proton antiporter, MnhG/PhaG subunit n=1 Tax=Rhodopseudomonas palustris (strain DX-1) TaxID=652103 RepID=E6VIH8_RHOPX|nr:monovalent cation/H(+) antiporter subunit G [Rhodopseudomonas sp. WA056]NEW87712.1 potassium:proton antiporter [Rhodopseudomonas sp. WA056]